MCPHSCSSSRDSDILDAARDLFARHGYDAVPMSAIAERAEVSKANVYHHFHSKEDLYFAVLRRACDEASARWSEVLSGSGPIADRLREYAHQHLLDMCNDPMQARLVLREVVEHSEHRCRKLAESVFGTSFNDVVAMFGESQRRGELRADVNPAFMAHILLAANASFFQWREIMRHMPGIDFADDPADYSRRLADVLLHGIASTDGPKKSNEPLCLEEDREE